MRWNLEKIKVKLDELGIELLTTDDEYYRQINDGVQPTKVKLDIKCTTCDGIAYGKDIRHINGRGQTRCKTCLSEVYRENMARQNIEWWKDDEYAERIRHRSSLRVGAMHQNYNPNLSDEEREIQRNTLANTKWRENVYARDQYTCVSCGDNRGGNLIAHHVLNWRDHKGLRYNLNNGITMCEECHKTFHSIYGYYDNNRIQIEEFCKKRLYVLDSKEKICEVAKLKSRSSVYGVSYRGEAGGWMARINVHQKEIYLLQSNNFEHCVIIRLLAERKYFKDAAPQKHLFKEYEIDRWESVDDFKASTQTVRGVNFISAKNKWVSKIGRKYEKDVYIGTFEKYEDAVTARLNKEYELYGDKSPQRHFFKKYGIPTA